MAKILIVDDSYAEIQLLESVLKGAGFDVVAISDPELTEQKVSLERPDLLLLDVVMPKRNGYEVLRSLRRQDATKGLPVVVVSSKNQDSDRAWGKRQGADDYVTKPFTSDELLGAVRRLVK
jgi:DNA-binding response OmpR family regulator